MMDAARLEALGIDAEEGLMYCADDTEFYEEMLAEYAVEGNAKLAELRRFFEARDWANYRIRAHSLKSTSRMIGALGISERAHGLELAAKENDAAAILSAHEPFIADCSALIEGIRGMIG